jgi:hypothetical protein
MFDTAELARYRFRLERSRNRAKKRPLSDIAVFDVKRMWVLVLFGLGLDKQILVCAVSQCVHALIPYERNFLNGIRYLNNFENTADDTDILYMLLHASIF